MRIYRQTTDQAENVLVSDDRVFYVVLSDGTELRLQEREKGKLQVNTPGGSLCIFPEVSNSVQLGTDEALFGKRARLRRLLQGEEMGHE